MRNGLPIVAWLAIVKVLTSSAEAVGAGFAIHEQSVKGLGNAFAGSGAVAEDASTIFFNPAGMTRIQGDQFLAGGYLIVPRLDFSDRGSHLNSVVGGAPISGRNGGDAGEVILLPNLYYLKRWTDRLKLGLGVNAPFGLVTDYDAGWKGRYHALHSELVTINLNPSIAYRLNEFLSVGLGFNVQYARANLSNAVDFSTVCFGSPAVRAACPLFGLTTPGNQVTDGHITLTGDDWAYGYNLGMLIEPSDAMRLGVHYRSPLDPKIKGNASFSLPSPAFAAATGAFSNTGASAGVSLPDSFSFSAYQQLTARWVLLGDISWTRWSRFHTLVINFVNPRQAAIVTPENWDDTLRYSLGATYTPDGPYTYRIGFAYDTSPVPDGPFRTPRIPDQDRVYIAAGASYRISPDVSVDLGYAHLFVREASIHNTEVNTGHLLSGAYALDADVVGLQIAWRIH